MVTEIWSSSGAGMLSASIKLDETTVTLGAAPLINTRWPEEAKPAPLMSTFIVRFELRNASTLSMRNGLTGSLKNIGPATGTQFPAWPGWQALLLLAESVANPSLSLM